MSYHSKIKFAEACGITTSNLATYIKRGKVILSGLGEDGEKNLIDDTNPINLAFLNKRKAKEKKKQLLNMVAPKTEQELTDLDSDDPNPTEYPSVDEIFDLDREYKKQLIKKLREDTALAIIKKEKLQGILIPTEGAMHVIVLFSKTASTAYHQEADNILVELSTMYNISSADMAIMRSKLIISTNRAITAAVDEAKKGINNIVREYSETRGKGERK